MPIQIITEEERLVYEFGDSRIYYRRLGLRAQQRIYSECMREGQVDYALAAIRTLEYCVVGWDGVVDAAGAPVEFKSGMGALLPPGVREGLLELIAESAKRQTDRLEGELKNSQGSSASNSPTE